jgi:hypothetical protein
MHRIWDSGVIENASPSENVWLDDLAAVDTPENRTKWTICTVEVWATEGLLAARAAYTVPGTDKRLRSGQKLGAEFFEIHMPVVWQRLYSLRTRSQISSGSTETFMIARLARSKRSANQQATSSESVHDHTRFRRRRRAWPAIPPVEDDFLVGHRTTRRRQFGTSGSRKHKRDDALGTAGMNRSMISRSVE